MIAEKTVRIPASHTASLDSETNKGIVTKVVIWQRSWFSMCKLVSKVIKEIKYLHCNNEQLKLRPFQGS